MKRRVYPLMLGLALVFSAVFVRADGYSLPQPDPNLDDPSNFHICATASCPGSDPNAIGTTFVASLTSGDPKMNNPWYLIVGVPFGHAAPTITGTGGFVVSNNGMGLDSGKALTASSGTDVYTLLGISGKGVNASNNWCNWGGGPGCTGGIQYDNGVLKLGVTGFELYEYQVTGATISGTNPATFNSSTLPAGTIILAYAVSGGVPYVTPFTQAGGAGGTPPPPPPGVPEPASLFLMGTGLVGIAGFLRRKLSV